MRRCICGRFSGQMPIAVASLISPSGMNCAGKYGVGVLSVASYSEAGLSALKTQWNFAETSAKNHGQKVDRAHWRIVMPFHLSESKEQAWREVAEGFKRWNNEYVAGILGRPDAKIIDDGYEAIRLMDETGGGIFGTPEDALEKIAKLQDLAGGFGTILCFAHDWAPLDKMLRSYELIARYVMPRCQGLLDSIDASARRVSENKHTLMAAATGAVMKAIASDQNAIAALTATTPQAFSLAGAQSIEQKKTDK